MREEKKSCERTRSLGYLGEDRRLKLVMGEDKTLW
jgi:hypothetical protein